MKKLFLLLVLFATLYTTKAVAQGGGDRDPAAMMQRMKERIKPGLIEKTKITDAQADKVIEINFSNQRKRREIRMDQALSTEEKTKKNSEIDEAQNKEFKAIPLTDEQVKEVNTFFEEYRKQQMEQRRNGGNGGN
jgi:Spy/CpxP family protein refolding chaperone